MYIRYIIYIPMLPSLSANSIPTSTHRCLADPDVSVEIKQAGVKSPDAFSESELRNGFHSAVTSNLSHTLTIHEEACLPPSGRKRRRRRGVFLKLLPLRRASSRPAERDRNATMLDGELKPKIVRRDEHIGMSVVSTLVGLKISLSRRS